MKTDYREILKQEFGERCRANPRYSLRAFARHIKLSPATVSLILNGKKGLSSQAANEIAKRLHWNKKESEYFLNLVNAEHGRSKATRRIAEAKLLELEKTPESKSLELDAFAVISDWYHFAILQIFKLKNFKSDKNWIAKKLSLHPKEVELALVRLQRLELLEKSPDGKLAPTKDTVFAPDGIPSEAIRKFHKQVLEKAIPALHTQSVDERYFNTTLLPIRQSDLPKAKSRIKEFQNKFEQEFTVCESDTADSVYAVSVQMFNLTVSNEGEIK